jgi:dynein intermediate chain, cytosolic
LFPYSSQERVTYNKEIQTADLESDTGAASDEDTREPTIREREITADPERMLERLEEESAILDREIEEEIRGLSLFCSLLYLSVEIYVQI